MDDLDHKILQLLAENARMPAGLAVLPRDRQLQLYN